MSRVIVVLGYSEPEDAGLHSVCAARLARAAATSTENDIVVLSGWSRGGDGHTEAVLMASSWQGAAREVVVDEDARSTVENFATGVRVARRAGASELVVVTSRWHAPRAGAAARWLLRGSGIRVVRAFPPGGASLRLRVREAALWLLLPTQLIRVRQARMDAAPDLSGRGTLTGGEVRVPEQESKAVRREQREPPQADRARGDGP